MTGCGRWSMTMRDETELRTFIESQLKARGLLESVDLDKSQFLDLYDAFFVEIVLRDDRKREEAVALLRALGEDVEADGKPLKSVVRTAWQIAAVGDPAQALSPDGRLLVSTFVPVRLKAGASELTVQVAITFLAGEELARLAGTQVDPKRVARTYVERLLKAGCESAWHAGVDRPPYVEVNASNAVAMYRDLQRTA